MIKIEGGGGSVVHGKNDYVTQFWSVIACFEAAYEFRDCSN